MAYSKAQVSFALFLSLNILFFSMVSSTYVPCPPAPEKRHKHPPKTPSAPANPAPPKNKGKCPINTLKLEACADVLDGLVHVVVRVPPKEHCCSLINGLVDLDAAVCLCTALKANVLGINLNVSVDLSLLLNYCGKGVPSGFQCP